MKPFNDKVSLFVDLPGFLHYSRSTILFFHTSRQKLYGMTFLASWKFPLILSLFVFFSFPLKTFNNKSFNQFNTGKFFPALSSTFCRNPEPGSPFIQKCQRFQYLQVLRTIIIFKCLPLSYHARNWNSCPGEI